MTSTARRSTRSGSQAFNNVSGWLGFTDKYWLTALVAGQCRDERRLPPVARAAATRPIMRSRRRGRARQTLTTQARLFAGAKEKTWLDRYEDAGIPKLSKSIDWGWFEFFMRPIFGLLMFLFHTFGNFGLAIICLTFIVRVIMFPIAQKQFQSMAAMRKVQPKLKAIQERFKDDKARQQQEILKLYQAEKINPAAGCLPIVLQIPVFYALYKVLLVSVEMRHQPFILWIKDLSARRPADPGQPVRPAPLRAAGVPRHRRPADPGRRDAVGVDEAQPAADGPGPGADLRASCRGSWCSSWRRSRPGCSFTGSPTIC